MQDHVNLSWVYSQGQVALRITLFFKCCQIQVYLSMFELAQWVTRLPGNLRIGGAIPVAAVSFFFFPFALIICITDM